MKMRFHLGFRGKIHTTDGEWLPVPKYVRIECCDCGLTHQYIFRVRNGILERQAWRETRITAAVRGWKTRRRKVWLPIETAPRDGSWFLVYNPESSMAWAPFDIAGWNEDGFYCDTDSSVPTDATHWMPFPEQPR